MINKIDSIHLDEVDRLAHSEHTVVISCQEKLNLDFLLDKVWEYLDFIRIYTKPRGKKPAFNDPLIMRNGSSIEHVCHSIHREMYKVTHTRTHIHTRSRARTHTLSGSAQSHFYGTPCMRRECSDALGRVDSLGALQTPRTHPPSLLLLPGCVWLRFIRTLNMDLSGEAPPNINHNVWALCTHARTKT